MLRDQYEKEKNPNQTMDTGKKKYFPNQGKGRTQHHVATGMVGVIRRLLEKDCYKNSILNN